MAILVPYENLVIACSCNTSQKKRLLLCSLLVDVVICRTAVRLKTI